MAPQQQCAQGDPSACTVQLDLAERGWYSGGVQTFMQARRRAGLCVCS
jgi:hypothetical protein